jgi:hypothetical protein
MPGMSMSLTTTSYFRRASRFRASLPLSATSTRQPAPSRTVANNSRSGTSSSTTSTRPSSLAVAALGSAVTRLDRVET